MTIEYHLNVTPDTDDGSFAFYSGQVIRLTVTLTSVGGSLPNATESVLLAEVFPSSELVPYGAPNSPTYPYTTDNQGTWIVLHRVSANLAQAQLEVLAWGYLTPSWPLRVQARRAEIPPFNTTVAINNIKVMVPVPNDVVLKPAKAPNETPSTSGGNYIYQLFYVATADNRPLRRMTVRLTAPNFTELTPGITGCRFFPAWLSTSEDSLVTHRDDDHNPYLEVVTDSEGYAELYICAASARGCYALDLQYDVGVAAGSAVQLVVADFAMQPDADIAPPRLDSTAPILDLGHQPELIGVTLPRYGGAVRGDRVMLFNNQMLESTVLVGQEGDETAPLGRPSSARINKSDVRSERYTTQANRLQYVVVADGHVARLSSYTDFRATGEPIGNNVINPPEGGDFAPPSVVEHLYFNTVNYQTVADGLHLRIKLTQQDNPELANQVQVGDLIEAHIYLSGYRAHSDEPVYGVRHQPDTYTQYITQEDLNRGELRIWFPRSEFIGFGQKFTGGTAGSFKARYVITKPDRLRSNQSRLLSHRLDTIPPDGSSREKKHPRPGPTF